MESCAQHAARSEINAARSEIRAARSEKLLRAAKIRANLPRAKISCYSAARHFFASRVAEPLRAKDYVQVGVGLYNQPVATHLSTVLHLGLVLGQIF